MCYLRYLHLDPQALRVEGERAKVERRVILRSQTTNSEPASQRHAHGQGDVQLTGWGQDWDHRWGRPHGAILSSQSAGHFGAASRTSALTLVHQYTLSLPFTSRGSQPMPYRMTRSCSRAAGLSIAGAIG